MQHNHSNNENNCQWIGEGEYCNKLSIKGKSYCQSHYNRVYLTCLPEMAEYITDKEINTILQDTD